MKEVRATTSQGLPLLLQQGRYEEFPESIRHYVKKSWVNSYRRFTDKGSERLRSRFAGILAGTNTKVVVALFPDEQAKRGEERVIGWAVFGGARTIHYLYVRNIYRHGGAGHVLLAARGPENQFLDATHWAKGLPKNGLFAIDDGPTIAYVGSDVIRT